MKLSSYAIFFPIKTPNPVYIKECLKCGARVSSDRAVQLPFCRCWVLQGSPAAAVYPAGCGVHSWRLQSSLGQQRPPCSYNRKQDRQMLNTRHRQVRDWKQFSSERTVLPYCTTGCILTQPMTMAITHTASQRCMQPKPSAHSSKKKTKHGPSHQPAASTHCTVSLRLAGHSEDGHCRSTSCALPLSHHHMTMSTVSQLIVKKNKNKKQEQENLFGEEDFHWAFCALARLFFVTEVMHGLRRVDQSQDQR